MNNERLTGSVRSAEICAPIPGARIRLLDKARTVLTETTSDEQGGFSLSSHPEADRFSLDAPGFAAKEMDVRGAKMPIRLLDDVLSGYHDQLHGFPGQAITARIHSPEPFTATLVRHGEQRRTVLELGEHPATGQQVPDGFFCDTGLDWTPTLTYTIPADTRPGLHSLHLVSRSGEQRAVPLIVSTPREKDRPSSNLLVLGSTTTWISYNVWGGRSRYRNFEEGISADAAMGNDSAWLWLKRAVASVLPPGVVPLVRRLLGKPPQASEAAPPWVYKTMAIRRPSPHCGLLDDTPTAKFTNHLAGGEWRVLAWLERENINYDMAALHQLNSDPELLQGYAGIILSTHCEYWSEAMYRRLECAHHAGAWIVNLGGNSIYRLIEMDEDGSTRCLNTKFSIGCTDETQLLGVRYTEEDYGSCAAYRILKPQHWIFSGVSLPEDLLFGHESLNQDTPQEPEKYDPAAPGRSDGLQGQGASGWETDKRSDTCPKDFVCIAKGQNNNGGADMMVREPRAGKGGIFTASSITFGGNLLIDDVSSGITKNVLSRIDSTSSHPCWHSRSKNSGAITAVAEEKKPW